MNLGLIPQLTIGIISWLALIVAVIIHELAHAVMADRLGDPTPRVQGRISLNPTAHLDLWGTVLIPLFLILSGARLILGWAKPVRFDPFNLEDPKRDAAIISLAGPLSNLLLAITTSILLHFLPQLQILNFKLIITLFQLFIQLNIILAVFNLLPIHPLDGFKIIGGLLSRKQYENWQELRPYGIFILILLIFPFGPGGSLLSNLIGPPISFLSSLLIPYP